AAGPRAVDRLRELIADDDYLGGRLTQFLEESGRIIPAASEALEQEDLERFGALVDQSQRGAETGLCNQVDETIALQRIARELGAHAASAFGAGFGGSVWALVPEQEAGAFAERWAAHYHRAHPDTVQVRTLVTRPGASAHRVTDPDHELAPAVPVLAHLAYTPAHRRAALRRRPPRLPGPRPRARAGGDPGAGHDRRGGRRRSAPRPLAGDRRARR